AEPASGGNRLLAERNRATVVAGPLRDLRQMKAQRRDHLVVAAVLREAERLADDALLAHHVAVAHAAEEALRAARERLDRGPARGARQLGRGRDQRLRLLVAAVPEVARARADQVEGAILGRGAVRSGPPEGLARRTELARVEGREPELLLQLAPTFGGH